MAISKHDIALRFSGLSAEKQKTFLKALKAQGIDFGQLPIVPSHADGRKALS